MHLSQTVWHGKVCLQKMSGLKPVSLYIANLLKHEFHLSPCHSGRSSHVPAIAHISKKTILQDAATSAALSWQNALKTKIVFCLQSVTVSGQFWKKAHGSCLHITVINEIPHSSRSLIRRTLSSICLQQKPVHFLQLPGFCCKKNWHPLCPLFPNESNQNWIAALFDLIFPHTSGGWEMRMNPCVTGLHGVRKMF